MSTFSLEQRSQTEHIDAFLVLRHYILDLLSLFMELKSINPNLKQDQIAKELGYSSFTLQRYRHDIKMQRLYKTSGPKTTQKPQIIPKDLQRLNPLTLSQMKLMQTNPFLEKQKKGHRIIETEMNI